MHAIHIHRLILTSTIACEWNNQTDQRASKCRRWPKSVYCGSGNSTARRRHEPQLHFISECFLFPGSVSSVRRSSGRTHPPYPHHGDLAIASGISGLYRADRHCDGELMGAGDNCHRAPTEKAPMVSPSIVTAQRNGRVERGFDF